MNEKKWYSDKLNIFLIFLILIISIEIFFVMNKGILKKYFHKEIKTENIIKETPIVELYKVTAESINMTYDTYGTIVSEYENNILFNTTDGIVNFINENRYVKKGDMLISLDTTVMEARLESLKTTLNLKNKKLERTKKLVKSNILSISEEEQLEIEIAEIESKIVETEQNIKNMKIFAVTDGYFFLNSNANKVGANVSHKQNIGYFFSSKRYIKFYLPHEFTKYFKNETSGEDEILDILFFPDFDNTGVPIKGSLKFSNNNDKLRPLTPQENEYKNSLCECFGELDNKDEISIQNFTNRSGKIHLKFNYKESYIMIPEIAVQQRGAKNFVYVVQDNMTILTEVEIIGTAENNMFKIKPGSISNNTVIILKGLNKVHHMTKIQAVS
jgi:hypothetical protein